MIQAIVSATVPAGQGREGSYVLAPEVLLLVAPDDSGRLFDPDGRFYTLNTSAALLLRETLERDSAAAAAAVAARFAADVRRVRRDLEQLVQELLRQRLIRRAGSPVSPRRLAPVLSSLLLAPGRRLVHALAPARQARAWALFAQARLSLRLGGWTATVAAWQRYYPIGPDTASGAQAEKLAGQVEEEVRAAAARYPLMITCKEKALCCWALARSAGLPAILVLGVNLFPLASHCWCEVGERVLSDFPDRCEGFTPVRRYE